MIKKEYMKPVMHVIRIQQRHIICASDGMNRKLQSEEVEDAWARRNSGFDVWDEDWNE